MIIYEFFPSSSSFLIFFIRFRSLCLHSVLCINTNVILFYFVTAILKTIIMPLLSFYILSMMNYIPVCLGPIVDLNYTSMPPFHAFVKYLIKLIVTCSSRYISSAINNFRPVLKLKKTHGYEMLRMRHRHASKSILTVLLFCVYSNSSEWVRTSVHLYFCFIQNVYIFF